MEWHSQQAYHSPQAHEQLTEILQAYNITHSILPNAWTYVTLISALTACDEEV